MLLFGSQTVTVPSLECVIVQVQYMDLARLACNLQKQYMYADSWAGNLTQREDYVRDRHIQHSVIIDLWKIVDKDVRKLLNQTLFWLLQ